MKSLKSIAAAVALLVSANAMATNVAAGVTPYGSGVSVQSRNVAIGYSTGYAQPVYSQHGYHRAPVVVPQYPQVQVYDERSTPRYYMDRNVGNRPYNFADPYANQ